MDTFYNFWGTSVSCTHGAAIYYTLLSYCNIILSNLRIICNGKAAQRHSYVHGAMFRKRRYYRWTADKGKSCSFIHTYHAF